MDESSIIPELGNADSFAFKHEDELMLFKKLGDLVGTGAAQLFRDACFIVDQHEKILPSHKTYLIGHLLREMGSSVLGVIKPLAEIEPDDACEALVKKLGL